MNIEEQRWRTLRGMSVVDILRTIRGLVEAGFAVHIGTDAQKVTRYTNFRGGGLSPEPASARTPRLLHDAPPRPDESSAEALPGGVAQHGVRAEAVRGRIGGRNAKGEEDRRNSIAPEKRSGR